MVKHNELNGAKQIMSEYMSEEECYSWSRGRCCNSLKQARTHTHTQTRGLSLEFQDMTRQNFRKEENVPLSAGSSTLFS